MVVVASGVDTLHLTYETQLSGLVLEELAELRDCARRRREEKDPTPVVWRRAGLTFVVGTGARAPYRFLLTGDETMTVLVGSNHGSGPNVMVELRSAFLWAHGWVLAVERVRGLVWALMAGTLDAPDHASVPGIERVFRIDLCVDFQGWHFDGGDYEERRFRCRAKEDGHGKRRVDFTGYSWGLGGNVGFRVYDKTAEIGGQESDALRRRKRAEARAAHAEGRKPRAIRPTRAKKAWFPLEVWPRCPEYVQGDPVWRAEAQLRKDVLKELGVRRDFVEVCANNLDGLWRNMVGSPDWKPEQAGQRGGRKRVEGTKGKRKNTQGAWISYRENFLSAEQNLSRIPVDPRWRKLQRTTFVAEQLPAVRTRAQEASYERALVGAQGYLSTLAAMKRVPVGIGHDAAFTRKEACRILEESLAQLDATQARTFNTRVLEKREARDGGSYACAVCNRHATKPPRQLRGCTIWAVCSGVVCRRAVAEDVRAQRARPMSTHDGRAYAQAQRRAWEARELARMEDRCDS